MLPRWERRGWFTYAPHHPALFLMADIARELARRAGLVPALPAVTRCALRCFSPTSRGSTTSTAQTAWKRSWTSARRP
ncbi:MAG: hypothetical protein M3169_13525 [Candidatus Eremiobacteraeota bacterium]|nr:hypothetical protein [Candidatus Eremiobacteraeota bacterium]